MIAEKELQPGFTAVRDQFASHFAPEYPLQELGAAFVIYEGDKKVVDLYGGYLDPERTRPWTSDSASVLWSAGKALLSVAVAQLVDSGALSYEKPVATWWPEFAQNGKDQITLGQILSHSAGMNGFAENTTSEDLYDWDLVADRMARQAPLWEPDTYVSYHGVTFGLLTGEVIRRVTGLMPSAYIAQFIAGPLDANLWVGVDSEWHGGIAQTVAPPEDGAAPAFSEVAQLTFRPLTNALSANLDAWRAAEIPAMNCFGTADGLARFYSALANDGYFRGFRLLSPEGIARMIEPRGKPYDEFFGPRQWGAGVALNRHHLFGAHPDAFGHDAWGGSFGFADPTNGRGIAYIANRMGPGVVGDPRAKALADQASR